jgi:hypothetical protein
MIYNNIFKKGRGKEEEEEMSIIIIAVYLSLLCALFLCCYATYCYWYF